MADALRKALSGLRALGEDHVSGAAEIAARAAALLEHYCRQERPDDPRLPYALAELAETTLTIQPSMAPLLNLANRIQLAAEREVLPLRRLQAELARLRRHRLQAAKRLARLFAARLRPRPATVLTYSYSSTVIAALVAARRRVARVLLSEARPMYEGRLMAERLAAQRIPVTLYLDAALPAQVAAADAVVVGADAVLAQRYFTKVGTGLLQEQARRARRPFFVLADTSKFLPPRLEAFHRVEDRPSEEVWRGAPAGVTVVNRNFEAIRLDSAVTLLTECGAMSPARLRAWLGQQPVAKRWQADANKR
ncbi:MAG TPA: hypothetical protein VNN18_08525 [Candidatus Xenobia bacterium]|nr:hypothetical protein [Candidatus Xenobia bacterium]